MKKIIFIPVLFMTLFVSCRKDNVMPDDTLTPAMARDSLYYIMKEWYYWYDLMPAVTREDYDDPYTLLEAMRYRTLDRWSYILTYDEYIAQITGTFVGHGFRIGLDDSGNARIAMIYDNSPLYSFGVRRGWIVKKINNTDVAPIIIAGDGAAYVSLIGPSQAGITNEFLFKRPDGSELTVSSAKSTFQINTVLHYDTLHLSTGVAGHLVFESFYPPAPDELATAFAFFKTNNIKDLILDLRYNSGGDLTIAQTLASYIAGDSRAGSVFAKLSYNDKHQDANTTLSFKTTPYSISLPKIVVITTRYSTSASEDVINGLAPFVNVVTLGDTTNGKPTGMNLWNVGNKYVMLPITFKIVNAQDQGDFFDGIFPAKVIPDDITRDFGDREELCLEEAIHYLETGSVSAKGGQIFNRYPQFSERPEWMNNVIIEK